MTNTRRNMKFLLILFCAMFVLLSVYLLYTLGKYGTRWFSSAYNLRTQYRQGNGIIEGWIYDRNGVTLASTPADDSARSYGARSALRRAVCHIVGDEYGQTTGAEMLFAKYTLGFDNTLAEGMTQYQNGLKRGADVYLTIDSRLCALAYDLMDEYWGAVVLLNYKTGEVLASVSQPTFDPERMQEYLNGERTLAGSAFVNRVNMGKYTPGSSFKIVTLIAALRNLPGVSERTFSCTGPLAFDKESGEYLAGVKLSADGKEAGHSSPDYDRDAEYAEDLSAQPQEEQGYSTVRDYNDDYHGELTLEEAFAYSCNTTFARLALEIGGPALAQTAKDLTIGDEFMFDDMMLNSSAYTLPDSDVTLAWSGVGQYKDIVTPMNMAMICAAIGNGGTMMQPKLLKQVAGTNGKITYALQPEAYKTILSPEEAEIVANYMRAAVKYGTGKRAKSDKVEIYGKTGSAEISSNKEIKTHAWFVGFAAEEHPLAVCVILEQAGTGGSVAAPLARKLIEKAVELGY